jgi:hypothetical protein
MRRGQLLLIISLMLISLFALASAEQTQTATSVNYIEISPTQTTVYTQTKTSLNCEENTPSFSISPINQQGQAGSTLVYNLTIKNNDVGCAPRSFLITGLAPSVEGEKWDIHFFIYGSKNYPDGERRANFVLDSGENPTVEERVTSKSSWPSGEFLHYSDLHYGNPGEEIYLDYLIRRNLTYEIVSETKKCPINCICNEGETITCPVLPVCEPPCYTSGNTCVCSIQETRTCKEGCICEGETITCPVEPVCESPCVKSGNTCSCPSLPTKICKADCDCSGEKMICPTEGPVCEPPCTQSGNTCSCPVQGLTKTCQVGCTCEGETIVCSTQETTPIIISIESTTGTSAVEIKKNGDKLEIKSGISLAISKETFVIKESKLYVQTSSLGDKQIKVMPDEVVSISKIDNIDSVKLETSEDKAVYSVSGSSSGKLLLVIPVTTKITQKISAENGDIIFIEKPWWSFLASGI